VTGRPWRELTAEEVANGRRWTGPVMHGTARTAEDDPRFDKTRAPVDSFAPNGPAVWAVLDRLTWFTMTDAHHLRRTAARWLKTLPCAPAGRQGFYEWYGPSLQPWRAAEAAGGTRPPDYESIREIGRNAGEMIRPVEAGHVRGEFSDAAARWDEAVCYAITTAQALLVADRPELSDNAYRYETGLWRMAFPGTIPATRHLEMTP
jgi:hypothetical protein